MSLATELAVKSIDQAGFERGIVIALQMVYGTYDEPTIAHEILNDAMLTCSDLLEHEPDLHDFDRDMLLELDKEL